MLGINKIGKHKGQKRGRNGHHESIINKATLLININPLDFLLDKITHNDKYQNRITKLNSCCLYCQTLVKISVRDLFLIVGEVFDQYFQAHVDNCYHYRDDDRYVEIAITSRCLPGAKPIDDSERGT